MGGKTCIKCGWIMNRPVTSNELKVLLSTTNQFISGRISNRHAKEVVKNVRKRVEWQKDLVGVHTEETPICRYCLFELVKLFMKEEDKLFEKEFLKNYDFDDSIIC